jgi:hypothetical protein
MYKKFGFRNITSLNGKDPDQYQTAGSGTVTNLKAGSGSVQSEKQDPDPYQNGLNPQHWRGRVQRKRAQRVKATFFTSAVDPK